LREIVTGGQDQIDPAERSRRATDFLRGRDVDQQEVVERLAAERAVGHQEAGNPDGDFGARPSPQGDRVAKLEALALGHGFADQSRIRFHDEVIKPDHRFRGHVLGREVVAKWGFRERIDAQDPDRPAIQAERLGHAVDDGRAGSQTKLGADAPVQVGGQAAGGAHDLMGGAARHAADTQLEGATGRAIGEVDGYAHGNAQRNPQHEQQALETPPADVALCETEQYGAHGSPATCLMGDSADWGASFPS